MSALPRAPENRKPRGGHCATTILGREVASVSAIACTAVNSKEDIARTKSAGFQAHVTKPMDPNVLVATIVDVIHSTPAIEAA
jgi:CheY-like chemotaxis protein